MSQPEKHPIVQELEAQQLEFDTVIDIGCGNGDFLRQIVETFGATGAGVDKNASRIDAAHSQVAEHALADRIAFVTQKAEALDFADASFDLATTALCMHELDDPGRGIAEIYRVLKQRGQLICLDWMQGVNVHPDQHPLSLEEMTQFCTEAGFRDVSVKQFDDRRFLCVAKK